MDYKEFKNIFLKENRKILWATSLFSITGTLILVFVILQKPYHVYKGHPIFEKRLLNEAICKYGFESIARNEPDKSLIHPQIITILEKDPMKLKIQLWHKLVADKENRCHLIIEANKKLLAFQIKLEETNDGIFDYRIFSITQKDS